MMVPSVDLTARDNGTFQATMHAALFYRGVTHGEASSGVKASAERIVQSTLVSGEIAMWENPVTARNVSYQVSFPGPRFQCEWRNISNPTEIYDLIEWAYPRKEFRNSTVHTWQGTDLGYLPNDISFFQFITKSTTHLGNSFNTNSDISKSNDTNLDQELDFYFRRYSRWEERMEDFQRDEWNNFTYKYEVVGDARRKQSELLKITCRLGRTTYLVDVDHNVGLEPSKISQRYKDDEFIPFRVNGSGIDNPNYSFAPFIFMNERHPSAALNPYSLSIADDDVPIPRDTDSKNQPDYTGWTQKMKNWRFKDYFFQVQTSAILEATLDILGGVLMHFGNVPQKRLQLQRYITLSSSILSTNLAQIDFDDPFNLTLKIDPKAIEDLFANITVSLGSLNRQNWKTNASVTVHDWDLVYEFNPTLLLLPYGTAILISFVLIIIGVYALRNNGVSAAGTSFLQIVSTTAAPGCDSLKTAAADCCLGGEKNFSEELMALPLKFGEIVTTGSGPGRLGSEKGGVYGSGVGVEGGGSKAGAVHNSVAGSIGSVGPRRTFGFGTFGEVITMKRRTIRKASVE